MFAALRLVLFDDGSLLKSVALAPWATWLVIAGGVIGVLRLPIDLIVLLRRRTPQRWEGDPAKMWPPPPSQLPPRT